MTPLHLQTRLLLAKEVGFSLLILLQSMADEKPVTDSLSHADSSPFIYTGGHDVWKVAMRAPYKDANGVEL